MALGGRCRQRRQKGPGKPSEGKCKCLLPTGGLVGDLNCETGGYKTIAVALVTVITWSVYVLPEANQDTQ